MSTSFKFFTACCATSLFAAGVAMGCSDQPYGGETDSTQSVPIPVVGGEPATIGEYPSTVALTDSTGEPFCTGTLVSPTVVVTAAHCLEDWWGSPISTNQVRVVYGYATPSTAPSAERRKVSSVHPHPQYQPNASTDSDGMGHTNDIGAVVLQQPIDNGVVTPILPAVDVDTELTVGREVHVVGYGIYNVNTQQGGKLYKGITPHVRHIQWEMLAGQPGEPDTCNGDSGGPAYLVVNGALFLTGITSRAWAKSTKSCGDGGLYTIASEYVAWLESVGGELDGGVTEGGFEGGGSDATLDAKPLLDASASCLSPTNDCHPVTNEGCDASKGEACRLDPDGTTSCHTAANDQPEGALCDATSRFCEPGLHCGATIRCAQYCCADSDCAAGACTPLMTVGGSLGTCDVPAKPDAEAPDAQPEASAPEAGEDAAQHVDAGLDAGVDAGDEASPEPEVNPSSERRVVQGAGCGCAVPGSDAPVRGGLMLAGLAAVLAVLRRRR